MLQVKISFLVQLNECQEYRMSSAKCMACRLHENTTRREKKSKPGNLFLPVPEIFTGEDVGGECGRTALRPEEERIEDSESRGKRSRHVVSLQYGCMMYNQVSAYPRQRSTESKALLGLTPQKQETGHECGLSND